jgi:NAD(P)-dependent dehydrogenase (short-subunit alcohol dehydrogenase family)
MAVPFASLIRASSGEAIARRLAAEGYQVCINDISRNAAQVNAIVVSIRHDHGPQSAVGVVADVRDAAEVQDMITRTVTHFDNDLTLMVANAGVCQIKDALSLTPEDVKFVMDVNFVGVVNCYTLAAKQMIAQQARIAVQEGACASHTERTGGWRHRIIGASSVVAFRPYPLSIHYSAAKWAVRGFTQGFAIEMAKHKISVNAYAPGVVATDMWSKIDADMSEAAHLKPGQATQAGAEASLMQRLATPEDIAGVVAGFLAGPNSNYVNGQTILIDGGTILT